MKWAWRGYRTARLFRDENVMVEEAFRIRMLQRRVGVKLSAFQELGLAWPSLPEHEAK
jgi:hypothetical protein